MEDRAEPRRGGAHLILAVGLALAVLGGAPGHAAAADPSVPPSESPTTSPAPTATPTPTATATPTPTATATATPTASPTPTPVATPVITRVNLYRSGAMVRQYTSYWCVPAATQSMVNLVRGTSNRTYRTQKFFYKRTRELNRYRYATLGNDPQGWARTLRAYSGRPYAALAFTSRSKAMARIVDSIERTGDPVGVTVRNGTHAWVVLGYRTSHDPTDPSKRTILGFYVSGPLGSTADMWPYRYLSVDRFNKSFTRYHEWQRRVIWEGTWVVIAQ